MTIFIIFVKLYTYFYGELDFQIELNCGVKSNYLYKKQDIHIYVADSQPNG